MRDILDTPAKRVNHRTLKDRQGSIFRDDLGRGHIVAITNNNEVDGYLLPPEAYEDARRALGEFARLRAAIPLLVAAARAGVAIPSETFEGLGLELPFDWRSLNEFQARVPLAITHTEEGAPMPAPETGLDQQFFEEEDDEELTVVDD